MPVASLPCASHRWEDVGEDGPWFREVNGEDLPRVGVERWASGILAGV